MVLRTLNNNLGWTTEKWKYNKLTSHMLRKFFETQLTDAECISEHITHMMGWKLPGMREHYYLTHPEELQKSYMKHFDYLTIENIETITIESPEVKKIREELSQERRLNGKKLSEIEENTKHLMWVAEVLKADPELADQFKKSAVEYNIKI